MAVVELPMMDVEDARALVGASVDGRQLLGDEPGEEIRGVLPVERSGRTRSTDESCTRPSAT